MQLLAAALEPNDGEGCQVFRIAACGPLCGCVWPTCPALNGSGGRSAVVEASQPPALPAGPWDGWVAMSEPWFSAMAQGCPETGEAWGWEGILGVGQVEGFCESLKSCQGQFSRRAPCGALPLEEEEMPQCEVGEGCHLSRSSQSSPPHWSRNSSVFMPPTRSKSDLKIPKRPNPFTSQ